MKPGYKQTEAGLIPQEWRVESLKDVSIISRLAGAEYTSFWKETPDGEIIALRGFNIGEGKIIERDFVRISNKLSLKLKRSRLCKGDVVYPCVGSIGNAVVITEDAKYHIQQNIARISPDQKIISSHYLANYLRSSLAAREVERFTSSSSQPSVLVGSLRQYRVPLPPTIDEQCAIAGALSDVDALIGALDQMIAKKRDLKQAAMQQLLTGQTRLPGFHGEWESGVVSDYFNSLNTRNTELNDNVLTISAQAGFVRQEEFFDKRVASAFLGHYYLIERDDFAYNRSYSKGYPFGAIKRLTKYDKGVVTTLYICFRLKRGIDAAANFFEQYFELGLLNFGLSSVTNEGGRAHGLLNITKTDFFSRTLRVPPSSEQTAIAEVLSDMDVELAALEQRRGKTRALKQGMMQELLTGRTRLL